MINTYGISHIQLAVRDLDKSQHFYNQLFGMNELFRFGSQAVMLQTPGASEVFTLNSDPDGQEHIGKMGGIAHFGFRLREPVDLKTIVLEVEKAGGAVLDQGARGKNKEEYYVFVTDPDGYELEIFWMPEHSCA